MSRLGTIGGLVWVLLIVGLATLNGSLLAYSLPLVAYLATAALLRPSHKTMAGEARLEKPSLAEGETVRVHGRLAVTGDPLELLDFSDLHPPALRRSSGIEAGLIRLTPTQPLEFDYQLRASRGLHHFPGIHCTATDPFNLFRDEWVLPAERTLLVRPSYSALRRMNISPLRTGVIAGAYPARSGGPGVEFFGLRQYSAGDPMRWVNWKASARSGRELFVNLFEQERVIDLGLIVDARAHSNAVFGGGSVYPYSVAAAASLADLFLSQGNRVGLLIYGSHLDWTVPAYGRLQRERIMSALAKTTEGESRVFEQIQHLPTRLFPSKTQLILISPLLPADLNHLIRLRARRYPLLVISPDRDQFEAAKLQSAPELPLARRLANLEQHLITRSLANAGVYRLLWDLELPFEHFIEQHLSRPQAWIRSIGAR